MFDGQVLREHILRKNQCIQTVSFYASDSIEAIEHALDAKVTKAREDGGEWVLLLGRSFLALERSRRLYSPRVFSCVHYCIQWDQITRVRID